MNVTRSQFDSTSLPFFATALVLSRALPHPLFGPLIDVKLKLCFKGFSIFGEVGNLQTPLFSCER
jgi:hypothetical protein